MNQWRTSDMYAIVQWKMIEETYIYIVNGGEGRVKNGRRDIIRFETEYYFCFTNSVRSLNAINNLRNYGDYIKETKTPCDGC